MLRRGAPVVSVLCGEGCARGGGLGASGQNRVTRPFEQIERFLQPSGIGGAVEGAAVIL